MQIRFSLFALLTILSLTFLASAQNGSANSKSQARKKTIECKSNDVSFRCPKGLAALAKGDVKGLWLFQNKKYGYGLFVFAPGSDSDEQEFIADTKKTLVSKLFPKESQNYEWKTIDAISMDNSESKYQKDKKAEIGFNEKQSVLFKYQHILFKGKNIFAGYVFEAGRGAEAKDYFEQGLGGDSAPACQDLVEIVFSITGEELEDTCTLSAIIGS